MTKMPEGFSSLTPYVIMDDVSVAIGFYKKALGATEKFCLNAPDGTAMHVELQVGNSLIMIGKSDPEQGKKSATSLGAGAISFYVYVDDVNIAFEKAKKAGMSEENAVEDMFWGDRMGTLVDPFNVKWTLAEHIRDVSPKEIEEAMKNMAKNSSC